MENTIDGLEKEFYNVIQVIGSDNFLKGLLETIKDPNFVKNLSTPKLSSYITLAKLNRKEKCSMLQFLKILCPDVYNAYFTGIIASICGALDSRADELIREFVERAAL